MKICEISSSIIKQVAPLKEKLTNELSKLNTPDGFPFFVTTHYAQRCMERGIDTSTTISMLSKAFKLYSKQLLSMGNRERVVLRNKSNTGIVLQRTLEQGKEAWILITIDKNLNNAENSIKELQL